MGSFSKTRIGLSGLVLLCVALMVSTCPATGETSRCPIRISSLPPDDRGGQAYRLVYDVPLAIDAFWRFKTSFDNDFLVKNRYIAQHRFIHQANNVVITENRYSVAPEAVFRWETVIFPRQRRLEFRLINKGDAGRHGHRFHYGHIQLAPFDGATRVTQVAYFDFWGAGFWARYPWSGGMQAFLEYTAKWECKEAVRFQRKRAASETPSSVESDK